MAVQPAYSPPAAARPPFAPAFVPPRPATPAEILDSAGSVVRVGRDTAIFHQGASVDALYRLVDGVVRLVKLLPDGRRQIVGFLQAGDVFGLTLGSAHVHSAEALTTATVRRVPRARLDALLDETPAVRLWLLKVAARDLAEAQDQMLLLGRKNAQERLCSFLVALSHRRAARGKDPAQLYVPMTRADIADYLGLTLETVSRTLGKLKAAGLIRLREGNKIELADPAALAALADGA